MKIKGKTLATSASLQGLEKLINDYFYSTTFKIEEGKIFNSKGEVKGYEVIKKKGRFVFKHEDSKK